MRLERDGERIGSFVGSRLWFASAPQVEVELDRVVAVEDRKSRRVGASAGREVTRAGDEERGEGLAVDGDLRRGGRGQVVAVGDRELDGVGPLLLEAVRHRRPRALRRIAEVPGKCRAVAGIGADEGDDVARFGRVLGIGELRERRARDREGARRRRRTALRNGDRLARRRERDGRSANDLAALACKVTSPPP